MDGAEGRQGQRVTGRYEIRDYRGGQLKMIVWCEPGRAELVMATIAPERLPLLAEALARYLADAG